MLDYHVRVELHGIHHSSSTYDTLHHVMEHVGFSRTIVGDDGVIYKLPPAEYRARSNRTAEEVRSFAVDAAERVVSTPVTVFVTQSVCAAWYGLDRAA